MIEVLKLLNGFDVVAPNTFFNRSSTGLRGHEFKSYKSSFCTNLRKFSFSNRIVQDWNSLPQHVVSSKLEVTLLIIDWIIITCTVGVYISHRGFLPLVGHLVY